MGVRGGPKVKNRTRNDFFYVLSLGVRDYHFELLAVRRVKKVRNHCLNSYTFEEHESDHFFRSGRQTKVRIKN